MRKTHLQHTVHFGPACQRGRSGGQLRGEHITVKFNDFIREWDDLRCTRCENGKLFAFLFRKHEAAIQTNATAGV